MQPQSVTGSTGGSSALLVLLRLTEIAFWRSRTFAEPLDVIRAIQTAMAMNLVLGGMGWTMTEAEWLNCTNPTPMVEFLRGKTSERKLRLFAVACCRRISHLLNDERSREAVKVGEQYADGLVTDESLDDVRENASDASGEAHRVAAASGWSTSTWIANAAANAAYGVCGHWQNWLSDSRLFETPIWAARATAGPEVEHVLSDVAQQQRFAAEQIVQCELLRDIVGPTPFKVVELDRTILMWNSGTVVKMAQGIYDNDAFDRLPILADALEEAGCADSYLLSHCRELGLHVRGCWVVDLILGKQ